ncbi:RING-H2 finger protein ATL57-like [Rutidosis leptorrhynchoides]|uniref:RING-H2 finger protein ATL57-like n=1 Tax=Rutidosis leptorrhynchoides TaxID=125765 RepID=UPI003A9A4713
MTPLISYHRNLLQEDASTAETVASPPPHFTSNSPFDSSLALTILILLTVLFFMAFFSLYIRRFSNITNSQEDSSQPPPRFHIRKRCGGLDAFTVRSLPVVPYGGESKMKTCSSECSICLSEFEDREMVKVIPYCRHAFHPTCIDTWLSSNVSCPLCRSTQLILSPN